MPVTHLSRQIRDVITNHDAAAYGQCLWSQSAPAPRPLSMLQLLPHLLVERGEELAEVIRHDLLSLEQDELLQGCPIIGVAGILNGGKSSLVASFLSAQGRQRVLCGGLPEQGTRRLVFWLPESWRADQGRWLGLQRLLEQIFNGPVEELALDVVPAHRQYNNRDGAAAQLHLPLIATDRGLDPLGVGFLDCPDIQRVGHSERGFMQQIARLCHAFLCVGRYDEIEDRRYVELATYLQQLMPGLPLFALINAIDGEYLPHQMLAVVHENPQLELFAAVYGAYDFKQRGDWQQYAPSGAATADYPIFYRLEADPQLNRGPVIDEIRLLSALPRQLRERRAALVHQLAMWRTLQHNLSVAQHEIHAQVLLLRTRLQQRVALIQKLCHDQFFDHLGLPLLQISPAVVSQLQQSFIRTAPLSLRLALQLQYRLGQQIRRLTSFGHRATAAERLDRIDAHQLTLLLRERLMDAELGIGLPESSAIHQLWGQVLAEIGAGDSDKDRHAELDAVTQGVWNQLPSRKAARLMVTSYLGTIATLGSVVMIPMDGGLSAALTTIHAGGITAISIGSGLLGAGALGAVGVLSSKTLFQQLEQTLHHHQLQQFTQTALRAFGLPEVMPDQSQSSVDGSPTAGSAAVTHSALVTGSCNLGARVVWITINPEIDGRVDSLIHQQIELLSREIAEEC